MTTAVIDFDTRVAITIHGASLAGTGVLLADPIVHISEVTAYTTAAMTSATERQVSTTMASRRLVSTERKVFTAHPIYDETFRLVLPHNRGLPPVGGAAADGSGATPAVVNRYLTLDVEGADGEFLGQAVCPFVLSAPSRGSTRRLMLLPRNAGSRSDALFRADAAKLEAMALDDFGHLTISFDVTLAPHGGVLLAPSRGLGAPADGSAPPPPPTMVPSNAPMPLPIGVIVRAMWLTNASSATCLGNTFSTFVEFGPDARAAIDTPKPCYLALQQAPHSAIFSCVTQKGAHGAPQTARVVVPMQPATAAFMDRDVCWCYPVHSSDGGQDWGVLMLTIRLVPKPVSEYELAAAGASSVAGPSTASATVWQRPFPECPPNALGVPLRWESDAHVARSDQRRWRRDCVLGARPSPEHVRHIFEATLGRVEMDTGVVQLITAFFGNRPAGGAGTGGGVAGTGVSPAEMRELLIAMAFACMPLHAALKFCFAVMRSRMPNALVAAEIAFILEHCLAPFTLDMPRAEVDRRVSDLFSLAGEGQYISYADYVEFFVHNDVLWYECGVTVEHGTEVRAQSAHGGRAASSAGGIGVGANSAAAASSSTATATATAGGPSSATVAGGVEWRTFTVRVLKTGRAFNVTAHTNDIIADVMGMVEASAGVAAHRQAWAYEGLPVDARRTVGAVLPQTPSGDVSIAERDESVLLVLVHREKGKRWEHRFPLSDKVLKLRAHVQQRTMIPLSRCVMRYAGNLMWDRHLLEHYKLSDGAIIEISTQ